MSLSLGELDFRTLLREGDAVTWPNGVGEPVALVSRLDEQAASCPPFSVLLGLGLGDALSPAHPNVAVRAFGGAGTNRRFFRESAAGVVPCNVSSLCDLVACGHLPVDVVLLQVAGPDASNHYCAGTGVHYLHEAIDRARLVIAQVNSQVPWTYGDTLIDGDRLHVLVRADTPLLEVPPAVPSDASATIGRHIANLVEDGATIQIGIGAIPDAALRAFAGKRRLGLHSGVIGDGVIELIESGVIDNRSKTIDPGLTVTMALHGSRRLNAFADRNASLRVRSPRYTHDPSVLAGLDRLVAINSALEVDLTGQANAETALGRQIGTVGGAIDFARAAMRSRNGRSIVAMPATAAGGRASRIVPKLSDGVVTTARSDADVVITEYGIASLRGRTLGERARALAAIAAPEFRNSLLEAAAGVV
jgi:acyl-CoA hydrolase